MRPLRLEACGFTAFRDLIEVDFEDADLFALVGPTGSGKSSVIDAICFALYGSVPRYDDLRLVAPAITQGELEAKVRFDFEADGARYSAVRIVRRTQSGASTKEARLERDGEQVLAGSADELTREIERLLGLPFEHFTKSVVLPQGAFARFLHDTPGERQKLLRELLLLGVYDRMRRRAHAIAELQSGRAGQLKVQLADLAGATEGALEAAGVLIATLEALERSVHETEPRLVELETGIRSASDRMAEAVGWAERLEALVPPKDVAKLATHVAEAEASVEAADKDLDEATGRLERADAECGALPDRLPLERALEAHDTIVGLQASVKFAEDAVTEARTAEEKAANGADDAADQVRAAREALDALRTEHRAHDLARTLVRGEPCPVCKQVVAKVPRVAELAALDQAEARLRKAEADEKKARSAAAEAGRRLASEEEKPAGLRKLVIEHEELAADHPDRDAIVVDLQRISNAEAERRTAFDDHRKATERVKKAKADVASADEAIAAHRAEFARSRDGVAALGPPMPKGEDLAADWTELAAWSALEAEKKRAEAEDVRVSSEAHLKERDGLIAELDAAFARAQVAVRAGRHRDAVVEALTEARSEHKRIRDDIARAGKLRGDLEKAERDSAVASALARHLMSTGFERWMIAEAIGRLCEGATGLLRELSDGQYSLTIDESGVFQVIDHRNADMVRSAKTLSGGETFLASLALALALAEHLAQLAAGGAARLEAIFLDEGFGTLDPETLETVAAAIENLGARGRMVGIVTHVRDLAERVPVRFEVRKGPRTSTVTRVVA